MNKNQRIHGIDALRAIAMILGILLHATIAYKTIALPSWPQDPASDHWLFDYLYLVVHSFRMPLFFLIAGFFCRFLLLKIGEKDFIVHRFKRIVIPFFGSLVLILPLTIFPFLVYHYQATQPGSWNEIFKSSFRQLFHWNGMAHLWFLYYLIIYYTIVIVINRVRGLVVLEKLAGFGSKAISNHLGLSLPFLIIVLALILLPESSTFLHVDTGIIPGPIYLLFFGFFFLLGWIVNKNSTSFFNRVTQLSWWLLVSGTALSVLVFYLDYHNSGPEETGRIMRFGIKLLAATQILLLVFGSIGFFLRYCRSESKLWKYISDASYWMYLIHLMIVAGLQVLLLRFEWPGVVKFSLILASTLTITLATYQWWIRYSKIGTLLHGKREKPKGG